MRLSKTLLVTVLLLEGCTICTTVKYDSLLQPTAHVTAIENKDDEWRPIRSAERIVVANAVLGDARSLVFRLLTYGSDDFNSVAFISVHDFYEFFVTRVQVPPWTPAKKELAELVAIEKVLIRQPNIFECFGIFFCHKEFLREASNAYNFYLAAREDLAAAEDRLNACESLGICGDEREELSRLTKGWKNSGIRQVVERSLARRAEITSQDPEIHKLEALELFNSRISRDDLIPQDDVDFERWLQSATMPPEEWSAALPKGATVIDVFPSWIDEKFLSLSLTIPTDQIGYLGVHTVFIPRKLVVMWSKNGDGSRDLAVIGLIGKTIGVKGPIS